MVVNKQEKLVTEKDPFGAVIGINFVILFGLPIILPSLWSGLQTYFPSFFTDTIGSYVMIGTFLLYVLGNLSLSIRYFILKRKILGCAFLLSALLPFLLGALLFGLLYLMCAGYHP